MELPEGAVPVDVARTVAIATGSNPVPEFKPRVPIQVQLPDGRKVGMDVPKAAQSQYMGRILQNAKFADEKLMGQEQLKVKALLYVTDIDGVAVEKPQDNFGRLKLEQDLTDDGVDLVTLAFIEHFPPIDSSQLVVIKK